MRKWNYSNRTGPSDDIETVCTDEKNERAKNEPQSENVMDNLHVKSSSSYGVGGSADRFRIKRWKHKKHESTETGEENIIYHLTYAV